MTRRDWYCEDVLSGKLDIKKVWEDERGLAFHHPRPQAEIDTEPYYSFNKKGR
jgi:hypothetical protein